MFQGDDSDELMAVFGLDPRLYTNEKEKEEKFPENHLGRIFFNLRFEGWNWSLNFFLTCCVCWQVRQSEWKFGIKDTEYKEYSEK